MGLSKSYGGLPALPGVMPELDAVVHDPSAPESHGPMDGKLLPNEQFTLAALKTELGTGKGFPVVHIASHFVLIAGSGDEPFLMMGGDNAGDANGFEWNLSDMENSPVAFHGTRLLTLSACSTAKDYKSRNGLEMDSLGMVAQQKDAEAVLATLWDVNDLSTSRIMSDFYSRWVKESRRWQSRGAAPGTACLFAWVGSASNGAPAAKEAAAAFETVDRMPRECRPRLRSSVLLGALRPHRKLSVASSLPSLTAGSGRKSIVRQFGHRKSNSGKEPHDKFNVPLLLGSRCAAGNGRVCLLRTGTGGACSAPG